MDLTQLSQMVSWLDEEHRRDREEIARLDQRLQSLILENQEQSRRIQDLEGRLANTQAQLTQFAQIQQALQQLKNEVVVMLDKQAEARLQMERDIERSRMSDREVSGRAIAEIRKELSRLSRLEEELTARQAEDQRLGEMLLALRQAVANVSKDLDDRTRTLPYMVEQRALDNKRIAQLQAEHVELLKRVDAISAKSPVLEERIARLERDLQKAQPTLEHLRTEQQAFLEAQRVADVERSRQMAAWEAEFAQQRELIEKHTVRLREFAAQYEAAGRALKALEEFQATIQRDQRQVSELQRLAEERQRKELAEWQAENEQRWKKETLRWDYQVQEQQKVNQKFAERFPPLEKQIALLQRDIEALWKLHSQLGNQQLQEAQRLLDLIAQALEGRPTPETR